MSHLGLSELPAGSQIFKFFVFVLIVLCLFLFLAFWPVNQWQNNDCTASEMIRRNTDILQLRKCGDKVSNFHHLKLVALDDENLLLCDPHSEKQLTWLAHHHSPCFSKSRVFWLLSSAAKTLTAHIIVSGGFLTQVWQSLVTATSRRKNTAWKYQGLTEE